MNAKQLYAERKKTGNCVDCGKKNRSKFVQCTACREATKARRIAREKKNAK
jgi:hypothetical protein